MSSSVHATWLGVLVVFALKSCISATLSSWKSMEDCLETYTDLSVLECPPPILKLQNGQTVQFGKLNARGSLGDVFYSEDEQYVFKRLKSISADKNLICREKEILFYLNGLHGDSVKMAEIDPVGIHPSCIANSILMEYAGKYTIKDLLHLGKPPSLKKLLAARMIEIVESLHETGLVHGDLHGGNFVFSNPEDVVGTLRLIDFGRAKSWLEMSDEEAHRVRNFDMECVLRLIAKKIA